MIHSYGMVVLASAIAVAAVPRGAPEASRPRIVVLGMLSKMPVSGVVWQYLHYLVGLRRLGVDVFYVEAHARTPSSFMTTRSRTIWPGPLSKIST